MSEKQSWEVQLEEKVKKLEKELEGMGHKLEQEAKKFEEKTEQFGRDVEHRAKEMAQDLKNKKPSGGGFFWGIVFVVAGFIWLGNGLGWFYADVPWAALFLIAGGLYMLVRYWDTSKKDEETQ